MGTLLRNRRYFYIVSFVLTVFAVLSLLTPPSFKPGIDFTGGTAASIEFEQDVTAQAVEEALARAGESGATVQPVDARHYSLRFGELTAEVRNDAGIVVTPSGQARLEQELDVIAPSTITSIDTVSGVIGGDNVRNAILAVLASMVVILLYMAWAFRNVPSPFRYGTAAIVALVHDVIIVMGVFSVGGKVAGMEVNAMFISGILTVIGYAVNDTIVVFDRVRENVGHNPGAPLEEVVTASLRETIARSLNTGLAALTMAVALLLFGGESIRPLIITLGVGIVFGTYGSLFIACPLLVSWETGELGRLMRRVTFRRPRAPAVPAR